jgi:hypothetical protein
VSESTLLSPKLTNWITGGIAAKNVSASPDCFDDLGEGCDFRNWPDSDAPTAARRVRLPR